MQRITWSGVALHAGKLPGYPASHGCIRLPYEFAIRLFHTTKMGARVIISHQELTPTEIAHARLFVPKAKPAPVAPAVAAVAPAKTEVAITQVAGKAEVTAEKTAPVSNSSGTASAAAAAVLPDTKPTEAVTAAAAKTNAADKDEPGAKIEALKAELTKPETDKAEAAMPDPAKAETPSPVLKVTGLRPAVGSEVPRVIPERQLRPGPVSVFVSRKERRLYVRKGFEPVFETSVEIADADRPLGTHVFTAMALSGEGAPARWTVVTMPPERVRVKRAEPARHGKRADRGKVVEIAGADPRPVTTAAEALDRVSMPRDAVDRISELMSVGASLVISDQGLGPETGLETDFVVLTR
jgi:hypothetical protein